MAYNQSYQRGNYNKSNNMSTTQSTTTGNMQTQKKNILFQTGLYKPTREGVKAIGSIQVKEDVTIPAGSYINLYEVDDKSKYKNADTAPDFSIRVTEGKLKAKQ